jgi:hypothetical protein
MERHWHDDISRESIPLTFQYLGELLCEPSTQWLDFLELQQENRTDQRPLIDREAAGAIEAIRFVLAGGAEPLLPFF